MPKNDPARYGDRPPISNICDRPTEMAHHLIRERVQIGDRVVDATLGNGHDSLFLADLVGPSGQVDSFDIQIEAIESSRKKLHELYSNQVTLHHAGHEKMASLVKHPLRAVMFNLGYLPGGDKQVITHSKTTLTALAAALGLLQPDGIVSIIAYIGHPGGMEEGDALKEFCRSLDPESFFVTFHPPASNNPVAPFLITIVRT